MVKYKSKNIRECKKCNDKLPVEVLFSFIFNLKLFHVLLIIINYNHYKNYIKIIIIINYCFLFPCLKLNRCNPNAFCFQQLVYNTCSHHVHVLHLTLNLDLFTHISKLVALHRRYGSSRLMAVLGHMEKSKTI